MLNSVPSIRFLLSLRVHWSRIEVWRWKGHLIPGELPAKRLLLIPSSLVSAGLEVLVPEEGVPRRLRRNPTELEAKTSP